MKSLAEIASDYKMAIKIVRLRIAKLSEMRDEAISVCKILCIEPETDPSVIELKDRIRPLQNMLNDLAEVTREVQNYYDRSWWRSGKYTFNQNKPRPAIYCEPVYDEAVNQRRRKRRNESLFRTGFSIVTLGKAKNGDRDVLPRSEDDG